MSSAESLGEKVGLLFLYATSIYIQDGFTPLHSASQNGHTDIVEQLLKAGASPHAQDKVSCVVCTELVYSSDVHPELFNGDFHVANPYM